MKRLLQAIVLLALIAGVSFASEKLTISAKEAYKLIGKPGVMFVNGDSETAFENGHIRGSVNMYAHHLHHSDIMGRMPCAPLFQCPKDAEHYIGMHGIDNDTMVIAYDNFRGPNATGVLAFFKSYGHKKVYVLDGGVEAIKALDPNQQKYDKLKAESRKVKKAYKKAKKAGNMDEYKKLKAEYKSIKKKMKELAKKLIIQRGIKKVDLGHGHHAYLCPEKEAKITPKHYHIDKKHIDLSWVAGKDEVYRAVLDRLKNGDKSKYVIIDTRSMIEIIGERKMDNVARGGHIPTAKFIEWKNITDFKNKKSFRDLKELEAVFKKYGVTKDKTIYAYCQVGTGRGSDIITALKLLGYPNAKVYSGSWDEWGNDMNLPIRR
ncbi:sulfurtransferase [Nitrosophilus kaiyonis]|uniref:sulfurtransferase n=1 Tax=Nitrosophilus kaiyonis TaxID=2930200 RepID=UPI0024920B33|nr:rhodanese-like domain-containing protein [Nitrosophilus kaiyonis]